MGVIETLKKSYDYLSFFQVSDLSHVEYEKTKLENDVFEDDIDRKLFEDAVIRAISTVKKSQERKCFLCIYLKTRHIKKLGRNLGSVNNGVGRLVPSICRKKLLKT